MNIVLKQQLIDLHSYLQSGSAMLLQCHGLLLIDKYLHSMPLNIPKPKVTHYVNFCYPVPGILKVLSKPARSYHCMVFKWLGPMSF